MMEEATRKHREVISRIIRDRVPEHGWQSTPVTLSHHGRTEQAFLRHPAGFGFSKIWEGEQLKPSRGTESGERVTINTPDSASDIYLEQTAKGHRIVGGAGNRLNGLLLQRPYKMEQPPPDNSEQEVDDSMAMSNLDSLPDGVNRHIIPLGEEQLEHYVNALYDEDDAKKRDVLERYPSGARTTALVNILRRMEPRHGLVVVARPENISHIKQELAPYRGNFGFYDNNGYPHGEVSHTAITPDIRYPVMSIPKHGVYYDQDPLPDDNLTKLVAAHHLTTDMEHEHIF